MNRKLAKRMAQSRDCSCVYGKDRDNNYDVMIDKIFDWFESEMEKINSYNKLWSDNGMVAPNPNNVEYIISKFSKNSKNLDIEGCNLVYTQVGETHHGCQCNFTGDDENHKLITKKLLEICNLFTEIGELNKI